jgi:hypothetical protein
MNITRHFQKTHAVIKYKLYVLEKQKKNERMYEKENEYIFSEEKRTDIEYSKISFLFFLPHSLVLFLFFNTYNFYFICDSSENTERYWSKSGNFFMNDF